MELKDIVEPEAVFSRLNATSKKHLLQELAQRAEDILGVKARVAFEAMLERERLGATGMGNGVAIPHARIAGLKGELQESSQRFRSRLSLKRWMMSLWIWCLRCWRQRMPAPTISGRWPGCRAACGMHRYAPSCVRPIMPQLSMRF